MAGVDAAASITALITFSVSVFQGCVKGYQLICAAKHANQDVSRIRCFLQWEELRLIEWGRRVNIDGEKQNHYLPWQLIRSTLQELRDTFADIDALKARYGLETALGDETQLASSDERRGIAKLWSYASPEARALRSRSASAATAQKLRLLHKLRWVALDQTKIADLVSTLTKFNDRLYAVLESQNQDFIRGALQALLQDLVSRTNFSQDLDAVKVLNASAYGSNSSAIGSAATLKQARISVSYDQRPSERPAANGPKPKVSRLKPEAICSISRHGNREVASYKSRKRDIDSWILLEWKQLSHPKLKRRVETLTLLLEQAVDSAFHTLPCLGYASDEPTTGGSPSYAYVYELGSRKGADASSKSPETTTLLELVEGKSKHQPGFRPSLTQRMQCAQGISEAILQFHTAGWLHKSIRSANIVFVRQAHDGSQQGPYVIGFEYSRVDNVLEVTETATSRADTDLYRHPDLLKPDRSVFCKAFDLYSLGCVLVENALWQPWEVVVESYFGQKDEPWEFYAVVNEPKVRDLWKGVSFAVGDTYAEAVRRCFFPEQDENEEEDNDSEASVKNEMEVVRLLKSCRC